MKKDAEERRRECFVEQREFRFRFSAKKTVQQFSEKHTQFLCEPEDLKYKN